MNQVFVRMNEWALVQGMVGYKRILEHADVPIDTKEQGLIVTREALEKLPEAYFHYFLNKYSLVKRNQSVLRSWHNKWKKGDKSFKKKLNKQLKDIENRAKNYFSDHPTGITLLENINKYRTQKDYDQELDKVLNEIIQAMENKDIDEKLTSNIFKAVHLKNYYGQVSFLNVSKNKLTIEEQIELFRRDFIQPVLDEWDFIQKLNENNTTNCIEILDKTNHKQLSSLKKSLKSTTTEDMKTYLDDHVFKCSLTDFPLGLYNFEEGIFSPLALSIGNALNMTWNGEGKTYFPICALARLLLFCSAAGATISNRKSVFVYFDGSFDQIYQANEHYHTEKDRDKTFDEVIFDLAREQHLRADWLAQNYMIFEYESDYDSKKTLLDYMIMTPSLIKLFQSHHKLFSYIHYSNKTRFIKMLLKNIDTKHLIAEVLREKIKNGYSSLEVLFMTILRHYSQFYQKEDEEQMEADKQKKYIWILYKSAETIRQKIGIKKAQGIAYRLLNAVQAGNKNTFMDTVMRVYISNDTEMPTILLESLHENKMDFATVANAWIAGLISKPNEGDVINEKE